MTFYSDRFDAIGVSNQVTVTEQRVLPVAVAIAQLELRALDHACSRFRNDSELSRFNAAGGGRMSSLLMEAVEAALGAAESTDGLVDPTIGNAMRAIGYDRDFALIGSTDGTRPGLEVRPAAGWKAIRVDRATAKIKIPTRVELDLGATAKAFAADRIAKRIHTVTRSPVLVSLGGDISVAGPEPSGGWPVLVTDDSRAQRARGQVVAVHAGGLATSSTTVRRWRTGDQELHHIVDPRTGAPAADYWRTVSVGARTCLEANAAATAAIVLGPQASVWLERRGISARLVRTDGTTETTGGWPTDEAVQAAAPARMTMRRPT